MELVTLFVRLQLVPVRGLLTVTELLRDEAERELYDPTRLRQDIEETEAAVEAGEISEEDAAQEHRETLEPKIAKPVPEDAPGEGAKTHDEETDEER